MHYTNRQLLLLLPTIPTAIVICRKGGHQCTRTQSHKGIQCAHRFDCDQTAIRSPGLPFNGLHPVIHVVIHVVVWIITHLLTPEGWKAELAWSVDPWRTPYWQSDHMSTIDQEKIRESPPATDRRPEPRRQPFSVCVVPQFGIFCHQMSASSTRTSLRSHYIHLISQETIARALKIVEIWRWKTHIISWSFKQLSALSVVSFLTCVYYMLLTILVML